MVATCRSWAPPEGGKVIAEIQLMVDALVELPQLLLDRTLVWSTRPARQKSGTDLHYPRRTEIQAAAQRWATLTLGSRGRASTGGNRTRRWYRMQRLRVRLPRLRWTAATCTRRLRTGRKRKWRR